MFPKALKTLQIFSAPDSSAPTLIPNKWVASPFPVHIKKKGLCSKYRIGSKIVKQISLLYIYNQSICITPFYAGIKGNLQKKKFGVDI